MNTVFKSLNIVNCFTCVIYITLFCIQIKRPRNDKYRQSLDYTVFITTNKRDTLYWTVNKT